MLYTLQLYEKMLFSVRPILHGERVLDSFNMVISGMKTTFYTKYMNEKYVRITQMNMNFSTAIEKKEYPLFDTFRLMDIHTIYITLYCLVTLKNLSLVQRPHYSFTLRAFFVIFLLINF